MELKPTTHGKLSYLIHTHAPTHDWVASPGEIDNVMIHDDQVLVDIEIDREEARDHKSWDPIKERVIVEITNGDGRVIYEHPIQIQQSTHCVTLGLRET